MKNIISHDIFWHISAGSWRNPPLPTVSLPLTGGVTPALPDFGSKEIKSNNVTLANNDRGNSKAQTPITSTTANLATSNAAGGNNRLKTSLHINTVYQLLKDNKLPHIKLARRYLISRVEFEKWLAGQPRQPTNTAN